MTRHLIADRSCQPTTTEREKSTSTNDTIGVTHTPAFNFDQLGLGLAEFIHLGCDFNAASTASATVTTIQNENEIKTNMKMDKTRWITNTKLIQLHQ